MNFLAHFQLAWPDDGLLAGALEGDYYKGPIGPDLPHAVAKGVTLHRAIDAYTDHHPAVVSLRQAFPPALRRYAGILIDLAFDHFLSNHWERYGPCPLPEFNHAVLRVLQAHDSALSQPARLMHRRMAEYSILTRYDDWSMVGASAARIGERFRRGNPLLEVDRQIAPLQGAISQAFDQFYPELVEFCAEKRLLL